MIDGMDTTLYKGAWIIIGVQQWTVEELTNKYAKLRMASWHKCHAIENGQEIELGAQTWIVTGSYKATIHLRPKDV